MKSAIAKETSLVLTEDKSPVSDSDSTVTFGSCLNSSSYNGYVTSTPTSDVAMFLVTSPNTVLTISDPRLR
ncbi:hypothetical protein RMATCC62417_14377 [Rhizopus microsporus]|nr:hypothetical protein RMATCC62417_14377 [Rhizopus microsporus]